MAHDAMNAIMNTSIAPSIAESKSPSDNQYLTAKLASVAIAQNNKAVRKNFTELSPHSGNS